MTNEQMLQENAAAIGLALGRRLKNSRLIYKMSRNGRPRGVPFVLNAAAYFAAAERTILFPYDWNVAISRFVACLIGLSKAGLLSPSNVYSNACEIIAAAECDPSDPDFKKRGKYYRCGSEENR